MIFIPHRRRCGGKGMRRSAVFVSAILVALGSIFGALLKKGFREGWTKESPTWLIVTAVVGAVVLVGGLVLLFLKWRNQEEG